MQLANDMAEKRIFPFVQQALKAFYNNHGSYCKASTGKPYEAVEQVVICQPGRLSISGVEQQLVWCLKEY